MMTIDDTLKRYRGLIDMLTRVPLIVMMGLVSQGTFQRVLFDIGGAANDTTLSTVLSVSADGAFFIFAMTVCVLGAIRLQPVLKSKGLLPRACALAGAFLLISLSFTDRGQVSDTNKIVALVLIVIGHGLMAYSIFHLGRSFSIMPEARRLVTSGPYAYVRHPLYVAEFIALIGSFFLYWTWLAALLCIVQVGLQFGRIMYEEGVLRAAFPEYADYARRVRRFIPRL